jgi:hypothetical protein
MSFAEIFDEDGNGEVDFKDFIPKSLFFNLVTLSFLDIFDEGGNCEVDFKEFIPKSLFKIS